jgi:hypothetical protein
MTNKKKKWSALFSAPLDARVAKFMRQYALIIV